MLILPKVAPLIAFLLGVLLLSPAKAADIAATNQPVSFYKQIRPLFQAHCQGCHQPAKAKGGYIMTEFQKLLVPGDEGRKPIVPGKPEESFLIEQIVPKNGEAEMPRGKPPLHDLEMELVKRWIAEGARDDSPANAGRAYDAENPPVYSRQPVITSLDYSPDGSLIAVAGFHEVLLHKSDGSGLAARLVGLSERVQSVRFSPDGKLLAVGGGQPGRMGEVQIWDVETRALKISLPIGYDTIYGVNWSPDGKLVSFGCPDKTVRAIEAATGKQVLQQMAHEDWVLDTVFSTNGSHVISVGRDMTTKLTEAPTQRFVDNITSITPGALRGGLHAVARHPTRDEVLVGGSHGRPEVFQVFRQAERKIGDNATLLRKFPEMEGRIFSVDYSPDGKVIVCGASLDARGAVAIYAADYDTTIPEVLLKAYEKTSGGYSKEEREAIEKFTTDGVKTLHKISLPAAVYAVSFSPDGKTVAAGTSGGTLLLIDVETGDIQRAMEAAPVVELSAAPVVANNAPNPSKASPQKASEPAPAPRVPVVASLTVLPNKISAASRNEQVQLLVTALTPNGESVDVTRHASFEIDAALGSVSPLGRFRPGQSGSGILRVEFGGKTAEVPVDLEEFTAIYEADFVRDVNPILSKLGCNAGACHGSKEGKNGFKLSLRGYDPLFDVRAFTDDHSSRRVNLASPDESLALLKATGAVPHEGGARTSLDSDQYAILRQWVSNGAKLDMTSPRVTAIDIFPKNPIVQEVGSRLQTRVVATYADGRTRDVTSEAFIESGNADVATADENGTITTLRRGEAPLLARYEGNYIATTVTVMGDRSGFVWQDPPVHNRIDALVAAKWKRLKILPSDLCTDAEFIRRVTLDLTGLPPTPEEVSEFLNNPRDQRSKREALIERLLNSREYAEHWALKWGDLLQVNRKFLGVEGAELFGKWIREQIRSNTPYDQFVRALLTASGSNKENPAASYWKILREPTEAMENTTHLFLGTRFNCNKCHDHPFERWTQDQYYSLAQYFAQVSFKKDEASGDKNVGGTAVEGAKPLFEIVSDKSEGGVVHDRIGKVVPAAFPYPAEYSSESNSVRRAELAAWITSPDNRYFAVSYVNRVWGYLMGVGLIEPLDDIRAGNPPTNPELMEHLTREFIESGFNTRHIIRQICQSRAYQLSVVTHSWNNDDAINYSHATARRLPAETLLDSVYRVTGSTPDFPGAKPGVRAAQLVDASVDDPSGFLGNLGRPPRESACECERSNDIKLSSVLALLSGPAVSGAVSDPENALARLVQAEPDYRSVARQVFLRVLNRPATEAELDAAVRYESAMEQEHTRLKAELANAEASWAARKPGLERERATAIAAAEKALSEYLVARAAKIAEAQRERNERISRAEADVKEEERLFPDRQAAWENSITPEHFATVWKPLNPRDVAGSGSVRVQRLPDGSIRSIASVGELPTYTVTAETTLTNITGIKLEALPDAELPNFGPGHANGDFALSEFVIEYAVKTNATKFSKVGITNGVASFIAHGHELKQLWNGVTEQGRREGWSVSTQTGRPHWAVFALEKPISDTNGIILKFSLHHRYEAPYELGRFRLWVTTSENPAAEGIAEELVAPLKVPPRRRNEPQQAVLASYARKQDPEMLKRDFTLELARKPLPEDAKLKELELGLARATREVPTDPALVQLRDDVALSERQLAKKRLTAAQDLAWALINTPAFLFNR